MGYGTGAIMAVPAHDERDFDFAKKFDLPIRAVVQPPAGWLAQHGGGGTDAAAWSAAYVGDGVAINSGSADGMAQAEAKERIITVLERGEAADGPSVGDVLLQRWPHERYIGPVHRSTQYKLRDWLFSRQRYWGEPFPIVLDRAGNAYDILEAELPLKLPEMDDFKPTGTPEPPLSKATKWVRYPRDGDKYTRETNTMPQWAGSCWYYLRYIDPRNDGRFVDPEKEKYWMPVDLYVGGVEHAVLHLLYARFWHKVLFDLGHVSSNEPFRRMVNQGLILGEVEAYAFHDAAGNAVSLADVRDVDEQPTTDGVVMVATAKTTGAPVVGRRVGDDQIEKAGDGYVLKADRSIRVDARSFKMSKSRGNVVNPDAIVADYGADAFRLYEMYMGPLEAQKPWSTRDIVGMSRFLSSVYRNLIGDDQTLAVDPGDAAPAKLAKIVDAPVPEALDRQMHRAIKKVGEDIAGLRFNTAIAELIKLNNSVTGSTEVPRELAENFTLMLAPFAPHLAEELWHRLGHHKSLARRPWPTYDPAKLIESTLEIPVQVNGKLRDKITVAADADEATVLAAAAAAEKVVPYLSGKDVKKRLYVPKKLVNFVVAP